MPGQAIDRVRAPVTQRRGNRRVWITQGVAIGGECRRERACADYPNRFFPVCIEEVERGERHIEGVLSENVAYALTGFDTGLGHGRPGAQVTHQSQASLDDHALGDLRY